jgi:hypothetical protein
MEVLILEIKTFEDNNNLEFRLENKEVILYPIEEQAWRDFILDMAEKHSSYYDYEEKVIAIKHTR